ncbi:hypothetical protein [Catenovulum sediminis]|uniref:hypothetical protein n=1 Tax=Catenovulum sediminis TaxID=1740262 RepID=UPI00117EFC7D|nr:hypothetical protein [Catenovulum sediminis]
MKYKLLISLFIFIMCSTASAQTPKELKCETYGYAQTKYSGSGGIDLYEQKGRPNWQLKISFEKGLSESNEPEMGFLQEKLTKITKQVYLGKGVDNGSAYEVAFVFSKDFDLMTLSQDGTFTGFYACLVTKK